LNPRSVDPRQLRVAECVRLLNSTPLGEVVQPQVVYRHLGRTGYACLMRGAGKVITCEPEPGNVELLRKNLA